LLDDEIQRVSPYDGTTDLAEDQQNADHGRP